MACAARVQSDLLKRTINGLAENTDKSMHEIIKQLTLTSKAVDDTYMRLRILAAEASEHQEDIKVEILTTVNQLAESISDRFDAQQLTLGDGLNELKQEISEMQMASTFREASVGKMLQKLSTAVGDSFMANMLDAADATKHREDIATAQRQLAYTILWRIDAHKATLNDQASENTERVLLKMERLAHQLRVLERDVSSSRKL